VAVGGGGGTRLVHIQRQLTPPHAAGKMEVGRETPDRQKDKEMRGKPSKFVILQERARRRGKGLPQDEARSAAVVTQSNEERGIERLELWRKGGL